MKTRGVGDTRKTYFLTRVLTCVRVTVHYFQLRREISERFNCEVLKDYNYNSSLITAVGKQMLAI